MSIITRIDYLDRLDLYQTEKPYMTTFEVPPEVGSTTNHRYVSHKAEVFDAKKQERAFSLDVHGFEFHTWPTQLQSEDFENDATIELRYYPELLARMKGIFPTAFEIHVLAHLRRKRVEPTDSPTLANAGVLDGQSRHPNVIAYAHTDFSPRGAHVAVQRILAARAHLPGRRFEIINVWRVTKGPNRDWPLGLCDYTTLDLEDVEFSDVIHKQKVGESTRLHYNDQQRWYYLDNQTTAEVAVFRNVDSRGLEIPFAMHLSFPNSNFDVSIEVSRRESIETRFVVFH